MIIIYEEDSHQLFVNCILLLFFMITYFLSFHDMERTLALNYIFVITFRIAYLYRQPLN